jgi:hypothetical protein
MTPVKLRSINGDNLTAEAEYNSRRDTHTVRALTPQLLRRVRILFQKKTRA